MANDTQVPTATSGDGPVEVTDHDDLDALRERHEVVLLEFHADWCPPCAALEPVIAALARDAAAGRLPTGGSDADVAVATVDVEVATHLRLAYGVRGLPAVVVFADGRAVETIPGARTADEYRAVIRRVAT